MSETQDIFEPVTRVSDGERRWAIGAHVGALLVFFLPLANVLPAFFIWYRARERSEFVRTHAIEAINFNLFWGVSSWLLIAFSQTIGADPARMAEIWVIFSATAAVYIAGQGKSYRYLLTARVVR